MNIAFDLDGVILPIEEFQLSEGQRFFKEKTIKDENGYGIKETFGCSDKEEAMFWIKNTFKFNRNVNAMPGLASVINRLKSEGDRVYLISSRALANENTILGNIMRNEIKNALERNGISVDGIIYTSTKAAAEDKKKAIENYNIHVMVEDYKNVIDNIKDVTNVICVTTRNNKDYKDSKIRRIETSEQLYEQIQEIKEMYNESYIELLNYIELDKMSNSEKIEYFRKLKEMYKSKIDPYSFEKQEMDCRKVVDKLQKMYNIIYKPYMINKEKFPTNGGIILAANHLHSFDPLLIMQNSNLPFHLLAKEELKNDPKWNKLFQKIGSIFVDNNSQESRKKAKEEMIKVVLNGGVIMMFPEGTRNKTENKLLKFHMGTVNVAQITGAPIYPIAINSDYKIIRNRLCACVGDPMYINPTDNLIEKNYELKEKISSMIDDVKKYEKRK